MLYFSRTRVWGKHKTKKPLTKYTPLLILTIDAFPVGVVADTVAVVEVDPSK